MPKSFGVVDTLYLGVDPSAFDSNGNLIPNPYLTYSADLTGLLTAGQTYRLRFAEVDYLSALNLGVDNISLLATPAATPEPGSFALLMGLSLSGSLWAVRRRSR